MILSKKKFYSKRKGKSFEHIVYLGSGNNCDYYLVKHIHVQEYEILVAGFKHNSGKTRNVYYDLNTAYFTKEKYLGEAIRLAKKYLILI